MKLYFVTYNSFHTIVFPSLSNADQVLLSPGKMKAFQKRKSYNSQKPSAIFGKQPGQQGSVPAGKQATWKTQVYNAAIASMASTRRSTEVSINLFEVQ